jgi:hypothetical protein
MSSGGYSSPPFESLRASALSNQESSFLIHHEQVMNHSLIPQLQLKIQIKAEKKADSQ